MLRDGRYHVERWMKEYIPADAVIRVPEPLEYLPRLEGYSYHYLTPYLPDFWEKPKPEYIVFSTIHSGRHDPETPEARFYARFMEVPPGYRLILKHRTRFPWLPLDFESVPTNLDKINPEILIYKKHKEIEGAGGTPQPMTITTSDLAPWAPMTRHCSMSAVFDGPETKYPLRTGAKSIRA